MISMKLTSVNVLGDGWLAECDNKLASHYDMSGWFRHDGGQMSNTDTHLREASCLTDCSALH